MLYGVTAAPLEVLDVPPIFISAASFAIVEGNIAIGQVAANDADPGDVVSYAIIGGVDAALFSIDGTTGALSFLSPPSFSSPADADANNIYDLIVSASDSILASTQSISVRVTKAVAIAGASIAVGVGNIATVSSFINGAGISASAGNLAALASRALTGLGPSLSAGSMAVTLAQYPAGIAGALSWCRLADSSTVTLVSSKISQVNDKTGNGNHLTQTSAGLRPGYSGAAPNAANAATLDGTTYLKCALIHNQPLTIIVAFKNSQTGAFVFDGQSGRNALGFLNASASSGSDHIAAYAGTGLGNDGTTASTNLDLVCTVVFNGASSRLRRNGVQLASGNAGAANDTGGFYFGAGQSGFFLNGNLYEWILYPGDIGDTDIATIENDVASTYGITF